MSEVIVELRHLNTGRVFKCKKVELFEENDDLYTIIDDIRKNVYIDEITKAYYMKTLPE
jgi:hypothetical protein